MRSEDLVFPRYATDDAEPRLSIEVKYHKSNNKMTSEMEKFLNRRALMISEGSAECFVRRDGGDSWSSCANTYSNSKMRGQPRRVRAAGSL